MSYRTKFINKKRRRKCCKSKNDFKLIIVDKNNSPVMDFLDEWVTIINSSNKDIRIVDLYNNFRNFTKSDDFTIEFTLEPKLENI